MAVYFVQADPTDPIKIGASSNPVARMAQIMTQHWKPLNLILVCKGKKKEEVAIHAWFAEERIQGEWFAASPRLLEFVERVRSGASPMELIRRPAPVYVPPPIPPDAAANVLAEVNEWLRAAPMSRAGIARMAGIAIGTLARSSREGWTPSMDVLARLKAAMEGKSCARRAPS